MRSARAPGQAAESLAQCQGVLCLWREAEDRGALKQFPIIEVIVLQKMAGVLKVPPASLKEKRACMTPILDRTIAGKKNSSKLEAVISD